MESLRQQTALTPCEKLDTCPRNLPEQVDMRRPNLHESSLELNEMGKNSSSSAGGREDVPHHLFRDEGLAQALEASKERANTDTVEPLATTKDNVCGSSQVLVSPETTSDPVVLNPSPGLGSHIAMQHLDDDALLIKRPIPRCKVSGKPLHYYPILPLPEDHQKKFNIVRNVFLHAVEMNVDLRPRLGRDIRFELSMCGVEGCDPEACILVHCTKDIQERLRKLLNRTGKKLQYLDFDKPTMRDGLLGLFSKNQPETSASTEPRFRLVFVAGDSILIRRASASHVDLYLGRTAKSEPCGLSVVFGISMATMGAVVTTDDEVYGLTVSHLFSADTTPAGPKAETKELPEDDSIEDPSDESSFDGQCPWYDDVEYGSDEESPTIPGSAWNVDPGSSQRAGERRPFAAGTKLETQSSHKNEPDLDWALIKIRLLDGIDEGESNPAVLFGNLTTLPRGSIRPAAIISANGIKSGFLADRMARTNERKSFGLLNFFSVDPKGTLDGDSGALIIDMDKADVFGHVIGSNLLGEAYVVPILETQAQISRISETEGPKNPLIGVLASGPPDPGSFGPDWKCVLFTSFPPLQESTRSASSSGNQSSTKEYSAAYKDMFYSKNPDRPHSLSLRKALDMARGTEFGPDPAVAAILQRELNSLWSKLLTRPDDYLFSRDEFDLFNYFRQQYENNPVGKRAIERFLMHYRIDPGSTR